MTSECCLDVEFLLSFCVFFVAKIMLPNDALHNFVKKLKAAIYVKFIYSEKATKFCEISTNYLTGST